MLVILNYCAVFNNTCYYNCCSRLLHTGKANKLSAMKKLSTPGSTVDSNEGVAAVAYVDSNGMLSFMPTTSTAPCTTQNEMFDDDGDATQNRRLRRIACSCPNCRDGSKK